MTKPPTSGTLSVICASTNAITQLRMLATSLPIELGPLEPEQRRIGYEAPRVHGPCRCCCVGRLRPNGTPKAKPQSPEMRLRYLKCDSCGHTTIATVEAAAVHSKHRRK